MCSKGRGLSIKLPISPNVAEMVRQRPGGEAPRAVGLASPLPSPLPPPAVATPRVGRPQPPPAVEAPALRRPVLRPRAVVAGTLRRPMAFGGAPAAPTPQMDAADRANLLALLDCGGLPSKKNDRNNAMENSVSCPRAITKGATAPALDVLQALQAPAAPPSPPQQQGGARSSVVREADAPPRALVNAASSRVVATRAESESGRCPLRYAAVLEEDSTLHHHRFPQRSRSSAVSAAKGRPPLRVEERVADARVPLVTKDLSFVDNRPLGVDPHVPTLLLRRAPTLAR